MPKTCVKCKEFEKVAENMGFCRKFNFLVSLELAKKDHVCEGMKED